MKNPSIAMKGFIEIFRKFLTNLVGNRFIQKVIKLSLKQVMPISKKKQ
jgi:hypothetical protein